jgi:hypothetical protein
VLSTAKAGWIAPKSKHPQSISNPRHQACAVSTVNPASKAPVASSVHGKKRPAKRKAASSNSTQGKIMAANSANQSGRTIW